MYSIKIWFWTNINPFFYFFEVSPMTGLVVNSTGNNKIINSVVSNLISEVFCLLHGFKSVLYLSTSNLNACT
jgi:hypothetical protein